MKKLLLAAAIAVLPCLPALSTPEPDYGCYMRNQAGRVVDLSTSICGFEISMVGGGDAAFLAEYRLQASSYPDVLRLLSSEKAEKLAIEMAKNYCQGRRLGRTNAQIMSVYNQTHAQIKAKGASQTSISAARNQVVISTVIAPKAYCPEFVPGASTSASRTSSYFPSRYSSGSYASPSGSYSSGSYATPSGVSSTGGTVYVDGYTRDNGTYVAPYTRRSPRR